jgi:ADP-heptose:LPS heptosyltransferase
LYKGENIAEVSIIIQHYFRLNLTISNEIENLPLDILMADAMHACIFRSNPLVGSQLPMKKILAIKGRRLGDTILWTSALEALHQLYPEARLDLGLPGAYDSLFENDPRIGRRWHFDRETSLWDLARSLRLEHYDLVLNFHASSRSALLSSLAGAKEKILHHHSRKPRRFFSDRRIPHLGTPMAATERDLNVVRSLGWSGGAPATRIYVTPEKKEKARNAIGEIPRPVVLIHPGASRPAKRWPLERFVELARLLAQGRTVGILTDPADDPFREEPYLKSLIARHALFFSRSNLQELAAVISESDCLVGVDSGLKHLAAAVGVPTVTLFGPESLGEWHCYSEERHAALQVKVLCRFNDASDPRFAWCGEHQCPLASHACLSLISPEQILSEVERVTSTAR